MPVNLDKPHLWKKDICRSVDFYNDWFMKFAPQAFRNTRLQTTKDVEFAFKKTKNLADIKPKVLIEYPSILPMLRMTTCPPIARDRLIGLADVPPNLVKNMEVDKKLPLRMKAKDLRINLKRIGRIIEKMIDPDIVVWKEREDNGKDEEVQRAATIVADRLCGAVADPIIRNAQEQRQLQAISNWLKSKGYKQLKSGEIDNFLSMPKGTFTFRLNVSVHLDSGKRVNIPIDVVIMKKNASTGDYPIFIEAKSAGDFTNVNKRRKEEAVKMSQLKKTYGEKIVFDLFLCGYFDSGYLGYEAAEGIDWVWEHRIQDMEKLGL